MRISIEPTALTQDELMTISGGHGGMIDPNGTPSTSDDGDTGCHLDPNG